MAQRIGVNRAAPCAIGRAAPRQRYRGACSDDGTLTAFREGLTAQAAVSRHEKTREAMPRGFRFDTYANVGLTRPIRQCGLST